MYDQSTPQATKACRHCGRVLPLPAFNHNKSYRDGYNSTCKDCQVHQNRGRSQAQRLYPDLGACEDCGEPATERHHLVDTSDNRRESVAFLCRRCHMARDGRLDALHDPANHHIKPPTPCRICGVLAKGLRDGRCHACNEYVRRHGTERDAYLSEKAINPYKPPRPCVICSTLTNKPTHGKCPTCYRYWLRTGIDRNPEQPRPPVQPKPCQECGAVVTGLKRGLCNNCYVYKLRTGRDRSEYLGTKTDRGG
jgi:hypothetical protein